MNTQEKRTIKSGVDRDKDLTSHTCHGTTTMAEIGDAIRLFYRSSPTRNVIWDLSDGNFASTSTDQISALAAQIKRMAHSRAGGKTAIVASADLGYGLGRMYQVFAQQAEQMSDIQVFRSCKEAEKWLETSSGA
jgi:hypothetical protein